nr:serine/threonine-protein kinase ATM [Ipomoea batatas]
MATQKEAETAETLAAGFTELTNPKTPPADNGNLGSVQNGDSVNEFVGDGISLLVQVHGTLETEKEQLALRGNNNSPVLKKGDGDSTEEKPQTEAINGDGKSGNEADDDDDEEEEEDEDERKDSVSEHTYSVGDYVWGKIKSHPWWPGRIYDPSDASEFAEKYRQTGRLLVVYFGDGSFSWCLPSQLKPFADNFEEMSKQSSIRSFLNAVDKALDEIGTLLVLGMTCQCIPQEHIDGCSWPLAMNAGIKTGVLVPKGDTRTLLLPSYDPRLVLLKLRELARTTSVPSRLEYVALTSWLSAFYRSKGGCRLSVYCEPGLIEGLEDNTRNHAVDGTDLNVPIEVPIKGPLEDEQVSYRNTGPINCPVLADDNLYHPRKEKSVAELMGENIRSDVGNNSDGGGVAQVTETGIKECRKETDCYSSAKIAKKRRNPLSIKCSENGSRNNVGEAKEESERSPASRERKKSKYLSPPYTSPRWITGRSSAKREFEAESEKISKTARVGEQMKPAAEEVVPVPISGHNSEEMKEKVLEQPDDLDMETQIGKENHEKIPGTVYTNASINQVLTEFQSTAIDPLYSSNSGTLDMVREFISAFRKSVYLNRTNYKVHNSRQSGRKRKSPCSPIENHVDVPSATNAKSQQRRKRTKLAKAETSELKKPASTSSGDAEDKEATRKSLIVTFSPGYPLPSKEELVRIFSRYGDLNEKETNTFYSSNCAQVVYENGSDAEVAFRKSVKQSPFGGAHVNYRLRYSPHKKDPRVLLDSQLEHDDGSEFGSIKQNLNILKSMLRKCNGKISQEEKFDLEGEIKGLLEKCLCGFESSTPSPDLLMRFSLVVHLWRIALQ